MASEPKDEWDDPTGVFLEVLGIECYTALDGSSTRLLLKGQLQSWVQGDDSKMLGEGAYDIVLSKGALVALQERLIHSVGHILGSDDGTS